MGEITRACLAVRQERYVIMANVLTADDGKVRREILGSQDGADPSAGPNRHFLAGPGHRPVLPAPRGLRDFMPCVLPCWPAGSAPRASCAACRPRPLRRRSPSSATPAT